MCILCGGFVSGPHWTDRRHEDAVREGRIPDGEYRTLRRRERLRRAAATSAALAHYGLRLDEWSGARYVLRDGKGRSEVVGDLGGVWAAAERLLGRPADPLDPALLGRLCR